MEIERKHNFFSFIITVVGCTLSFLMKKPRCGNSKSLASSVFVYTKTSSCLLGIAPSPKNSPQVDWLRIRFPNAFRLRRCRYSLLDYTHYSKNSVQKTSLPDVF